MAKRNWGESFLKSGWPLEHVTLTRLTKMGWDCEPNYEYERTNRKREMAWFEIDMIAYAPYHRQGNLRLLIECKYHDGQRFWFFLPCTTVDHQAQYEALSAGEDLESDTHVIHYAPYDPLDKPERHSLIELAPKSIWGVTISKAGTREENTLHAAVEQLGYGFVPFCLDRLYHFCRYEPEAVIPAVVTSAKLFRLKPVLDDLDVVRNANSPYDIAEELPWTWYYYSPRSELRYHNLDEIDTWKRRHSGIEFQPLEDRLAALWGSPHWVLVVNIDSLADAVQAVYSAFLKLPKDFSKNRILRKTVEDSARNARKRSVESSSERDSV